MIYTSEHRILRIHDNDNNIVVEVGEGGEEEEETPTHSDCIDDGLSNGEEIDPRETQEERMTRIMEGVEIEDIEVISALKYSRQYV
ncbi:MAG: hypothetical protein MHMPM18_004135 [Marteilia pararefringens]